MTSIEWTDEVWNPTVGCSKTSPGCDHCYAIGVAHRAMQPAHEGLTVRRPGERPDWTGEVRCLPERLDQPLKWRKPRRVFVNSMSDLFHPGVPNDFIVDVFTRIHASIHTYQVLTKRPTRMARLLADPKFHHELVYRTIDVVEANEQLPAVTWDHYLNAEHRADNGQPIMPNLWLGVSVEDPDRLWRVEHLRVEELPGIRFLSLEPLLAPIPDIDLTGIDWVIIGGESGPGARRMDLGWVRDIVTMADSAGAAVFVKQLGRVLAGELGMSDRKGHNLDEFPADLRRREMPALWTRWS